MICCGRKGMAVIQSIPGVDVVMSFNQFIQDMNKSFHSEDPEFYRIPDSRELVAQYLLLYDADDIEDFVNLDFDHTRIMVRLGVHSSSDQAEIIHNIKSFISQIDSAGLSMRVTGQAVQDVNIIDTLVYGQVYSLSIVLGVISLLMFLVFRSVALGFLSLIPNIFPVLLHFGIIGFLGIPLNTATALIAAVAIGIAVDDTIHFLSRYNRERKKGLDVVRAVEITMLVKGRALISSSVILCVAFGVLVTSDFIPNIYFGMLSGLIMITAVIGDIVILPAILMMAKRRNDKGR